MSNNIFSSKTFNLITDNIDTDQIIPAQFLTTTTREGLAAGAFFNLRFDDEGNEREDHVFKNFDAKETAILVCGNNFGCGSSREHAPWSLLDLGFKVVVSTQFADIFRNNSIKNGLLPLEIDKSALDYLEANPNTQLTIDVANTNCEIHGYASIDFPLDEFSKYCLSNNYDQLDYLMSQKNKISAYEQRA